MKYKHYDITIPEDNPFANCKLNRRQYANVLTQIVSNYADGFVMSVNGAWGTGKSTFMKMWEATLKLEGFKSVYFNAWENDFTSDPLVALLGEIQGAITSEQESAFNKVLEIGGRIAHNAIPTLVKVATKKFLGEDAANIAEALTKEAGNVFKEEVLEYQNKKEQFVAFREELSKFIESEVEQKPLIFIVDELDRCRPDYAVEVLEHIKHFFSLKGIVFVLAIDKEQLCNAIRGHYGSDRINAEEYLRRFIDVEYILPEPNMETYCNYLYEYFQFDNFFQQPARNQHQMFRDDGDAFLQGVVQLAHEYHLSLRQIEKLCAHTRLVLRSLKSHYLFPNMTLMLIFLREYNHTAYLKIVHYEFNYQELVDFVSTIFPTKLFKQEHEYASSAMARGLAQLLYCYSQGIASTGYPKPLFKPTQSGEKATLTVSISYANVEYITNAIEWYKRSYYSFSNWGYLINSINLLSRLVD